MKRNEKIDPEFDEIIFRNRNKNYGAYDLRKRYKSVISLSVLFGIAFCVIIFTTLSFTIKDVESSTRLDSLIHIKVDFALRDYPVPVVPKAPSGMERIIKNLKPVITDDTSKADDYIPTAWEIIETTIDPGVNDTLIKDPEPVDEIIPDDNIPRLFVKEMPEYPGGIPALLKFVSDNLKYPEDALQNNIQGKVFIKFVVNKDGSVDRIEVIKGVDPSLDRAAVEVINLLPDFRPGRQNGVPVPVWFTMPVVFVIQ